MVCAAAAEVSSPEEREEGEADMGLRNFHSQLFHSRKLNSSWPMETGKVNITCRKFLYMGRQH